MNILKRFSILTVILVFTIAFSSEANALGHKHKNPDYSKYQSGHNHTIGGKCKPGGTADAPLDGGLLALLAGAGAIYVAKRKKKKNAE